MIKLTRARGNSVNAKFSGQNKLDRDLILLSGQRNVLLATIQKHDFQSTYWKTSKEQLKKESYNKCAYCEADTSVVAHGDVEHFRPKSDYWWLAYTYDNYLFSCQICNQTYKSDKFPIVGSKMKGPKVLGTTSDKALKALLGKISPDPNNIKVPMTLAAFTTAHNKEKALLLNPYFDDPPRHFAYEFDDNKKEVILIPANNTRRTKSIVQSCIDFYGLNRVELRDLRYGEFKKFRIFKKFLNTTNTDQDVRNEATDMINEMKSDKSMFAGMIRFFDALPFNQLS